MTAFCRLNRWNLRLAPEELQRNSAVVHATCEAHPIAITVVPQCPARSELESSVPFVVRLLNESCQSELTHSYFLRLPRFVLEDREVSLAAATVPHEARVHPNWEYWADFWCDAARRMKSNWDQCFEQIPPDMWAEPEFLNIVQHAGIRFNDDCHRRRLFRALLRRGLQS